MPMMFRGFDRGGFQTPPFLPQDEPMGMGGSAAPAKAGFFDRGGMGVNILGGVADAVATGFGAAPVFGPVQAQHRQRQQQLEDRRAAKLDGLDIWQAQEDYKRANPNPGAPHYWETNDGSLGIVGPDGKPQILYKDPTPKVTWTQVDLPNGQKQLIPSINGQMQTGGAPQRPAIGAVIADPRKAGGATPGGSRGFP